MQVDVYATSMKQPTKEDADVQKCVIAYDSDWWSWRSVGYQEIGKYPAKFPAWFRPPDIGRMIAGKKE